jgi:acyl-CoA thioesterase-1
MIRFIIILFALFSLPATHAAQAARILIWGDSLSAGYGIALEKSWPHLLDDKLAVEGYRYTLVNASISGETSSGGRNRLPAELERSHPAIVIIALGANDGLRGQPVSALRGNLESMVRASQAAGAKVLLIGMRMPPNFGPAYTQKFQQTYAELAALYKTALLPFMMEGFAPRSELFQGDHLHPTAEAQPLILQNLWPALKPLLHK